jgi:hypothetical protein
VCVCDVLGTCTLCKTRTQTRAHNKPTAAGNECLLLLIELPDVLIRAPLTSRSEEMMVLRARSMLLTFGGPALPASPHPRSLFLSPYMHMHADRLCMWHAMPTSGPTSHGALPPPPPPPTPPHPPPPHPPFPSPHALSPLQGGRKQSDPEQSLSDLLRRSHMLLFPCDLHVVYGSEYSTCEAPNSLPDWAPPCPPVTGVLVEANYVRVDFQAHEYERIILWSVHLMCVRVCVCEIESVSVCAACVYLCVCVCVCPCACALTGPAME